MTQISNTGNVVRLAIAQALLMTNINVNITNTALVGSLLALVVLVPNYFYAGYYFSSSAVQLISLLAIAGVKIPKPSLTRSGGRSIGVFIRNPVFVVGMICAAIGYALMSYLMTATPLQVVNVTQLGTSANATIIQWHVVAMFAPSFFTGSLIQRFGIMKILSIGLLAYIMAMFTALVGNQFSHYFVALFLAGSGGISFILVTVRWLLVQQQLRKKVEFKVWLIWLQQHWSLWHHYPLAGYIAISAGIFLF